jgi:hypothetical protein
LSECLEEAGDQGKSNVTERRVEEGVVLFVDCCEECDPSSPASIRLFCVVLAMSVKDAG